MRRPGPRPVEVTIPLLLRTLALGRVRLGRLQESLTAVADAEVRARGARAAARRVVLAHVRRFVRAFADRVGLPDDEDVRRHLRRLREERGLPRSFVEDRAAAVELLYQGLSTRPGPEVPAPPAPASLRVDRRGGIACARRPGRAATLHPDPGHG